MIACTLYHVPLYRTHYTEGGYTGVNVEGVLIWGTIYAFFLLPLTTPLARLVIQVFFELLKKYKAAY